MSEPRRRPGRARHPGRFYGPNHEEVGGVFEYHEYPGSHIVGAFAAVRSKSEIPLRRALPGAFFAMPYPPDMEGNYTILPRWIRKFG